MALARVGTSGWSYREWVGGVYPAGTPPARMLAFYAARLSTAEAHSTFRRHPTAKALDGWRADVPAGFRFVPKAHVGLTHRRDLGGMEERVERFFTSLAPLGAQLGPVLFQLPHRQPDMGRLERLLAALPPGTRAAFELAAPWHLPAVVDRLESHGATLVVADTDVDRDRAGGPGPPGPPDPSDVGPFRYIRLRRAGYTDEQLDRWARRIADEVAGGVDVYAFVRHDDRGEAPRRAIRLAETLARLAPSAACDDTAAVAALLGRPPRGRFDVVVRNGDGRPVVIRNEPVLEDGTPMPTRYWLVDEDRRRAVSRLESGGGVRAAAAAVGPDALAAAHARYAAERDAALPGSHRGVRPEGGVAGTRQGVKCLHAHYAWYLAGGDDPVGRWVDQQLASP